MNFFVNEAEPWVAVDLEGLKVPPLFTKTLFLIFDSFLFRMAGASFVLPGIRTVVDHDLLFH